MGIELFCTSWLGQGREIKDWQTSFVLHSMSAVSDNRDLTVSFMEASGKEDFSLSISAQEKTVDV